MNKPSFVTGLATGIFVAAIIALSARLIWVQTRPIALSGGGKHRNSPDTRYEATAWNMMQRKISGEMRQYYSFVVSDNDTGLEVCRHEIPMPEKPVRFRGGPGEVYWEEDSKSVQFGTPDTIVWSYTLPSNTTSQK